MVSPPTSDQLREFVELKLARDRALGLGYSLNNVHTSYEHWVYSQPGEAAQASGGPPSPGTGSRQPAKDVGGINCKWSWVKATGNKSAVELVKVVEDSASTNNFISISQVNKLGLQRRSMEPVFHSMMYGHFMSTECVDVEWVSREMSGTAKFYIAPANAPIEMLVGSSFINQHPCVFMEEKPKTMDVLLTVQAEIKVPSTCTSMQKSRQIHD